MKALHACHNRFVKPRCGGHGSYVRHEIYVALSADDLKKAAEQRGMKACERCVSILSGTRRFG